jgi:hypothetical protein
VDEPSESFSAPNMGEGDAGRGPWRRFFDWWSLVEEAVGAM